MRWVPCLFFLSGACGLVYQVVWARMLTVVFGATVLAVSTVLSAFMAGLALGSFLLGRRVDRVRRPLRVFALLEAGIGSYALLFPTLCGGIGSSAAGLLPALGPEGGALYPALRFATSFALLLVPTALMGATLPVLTKFVVRRLSDVGIGVGLLYGLNTLGAVAGVVLITFFLMEALGLETSTYAVAAVNFTVAAVAWLIDRRLPVAAAQATEAAAPQRRADSTPAPAGSPVLPGYLLAVVMAGFGLSGFAALGYEVAWLRLLIVTFQANTHYDFSIILIAFLLGISLGSFACSRYLRRGRDLLSLFGVMEILIGLMGICSVFLFVWSTEWIESVVQSRSWWQYRLGMFSLAFAIMFVPTLLMGALFPVVSRINTRALQRLGRGVGDAYAVNSLGSIGGSVVTGFVLIPAFGTEGAFRALGLLNLAVGLAVLLLHPGFRSRARKGIVVGAALAAAVLAVALGPRDVLRRIAQPSRPGAELVFYSEGREGVVTVVAQPGYREMQFNRGNQVPSDFPSLQLFRLLGHLPLLLHEDPQEVLVIALGGGIALGSVAQHDLKEVECVEMVPDVLEAAREEFGPFNHRVMERLEDLPIDIVIDDGRNYLLTRSRKYDVITGDATHPSTTDSWVLYTREFYQLCRAHLAEGGIFAQWLPYHALRIEDFKTVLRTFGGVFEHATLWHTSNYALMVGTTQPLRIDMERLERAFDHPSVRESLEEVGLGRPIDLLSCFLLDEVSFSDYVGGGAVNTDDHPYLSFASPGSFDAQMWRVLDDLGRYVEDHPVELGPWILFPDEAGRQVWRLRLATYFESKRHELTGDIQRLRLDWDGASRAYGKALEVNPEANTAAYHYRQIGRPARSH